MSSIDRSSDSPGRAERQFRDAFDRLRLGKSIQLPKGAKVTQNNIAREAGVDPSALRKARFPAFIAEVQAWMTENGSHIERESPRKRILAGRERNRDLREQLTEARAERDDAMSKLVDAEAHIVALTLEVQILRAASPSSVTPMRDPRRNARSG